MIDRTLGQVAHATGGRLHGDPDRHIDAIATDSRALPGGAALFVALRGEHHDGHDHAAAAARAGAAAVLADRPLPDLAVPVIEVADTWRALRDLARDVRRDIAPTAVAITGSVGKTTVKDLTAAAVGAGLRVHAARGSYNNEAGVPLTVLGLRHDTQVLIAEVGARRVGDIAHLAPIVAPNVAVVTAVRAVHLEIFGSIEAIGRAKAELVDALEPGGIAVLNVADPAVAAMAGRAASVLRVGLDVADADVTARDVRLDRLARPRATALTPWGEVDLVLPLAGRHHVANALLALGVAGHLGVDLAAAAAALASAPLSPWRGEVTEIAGVTVLNDAYNSNPTAAIAALDTLAAIERTGRSIAVLGVMAEIGPTSDVDHGSVGARCVDLGIDHVVVVGPGARGIATGAREAGAGPDTIVEVPDATAASAWLRDAVAAGDVVLVKASRVAGLETVAAGLHGGTHGGGPHGDGPEADR